MDGAMKTAEELVREDIAAGFKPFVDEMYAWIDKHGWPKNPDGTYAKFVTGNVIHTYSPDEQPPQIP
jgi:hypothetical protein